MYSDLPNLIENMLCHLAYATLHSKDCWYAGQSYHGLMFELKQTEFSGLPWSNNYGKKLS